MGWASSRPWTHSPPESPVAENTLPRTLPPLPGVKEPFFAIVLGVVEGGYYGTIPVGRMQLEMARQATRTRIPPNPLSRLVRSPHAGRPVATLEVHSSRIIELPLPYDIIGYHPGTLRGSQALTFHEYEFGTVSFVIPGEHKDDPPRPMTLEEVRVFGLARGYFEVDVDGWVDKLMGKIDDTRMVALASFRHEGRIYGISMGYNSKGEGRTGLFDFAKDEIVFPIPRDYKFAGILLRGRVERLMPGLAERGKAFGTGEPR